MPNHGSVIIHVELGEERKLTERIKEITADGPIVFYDGECGLCDRFIKLLVRIDKAKRLRFSTLQGETAREFVVGPQGNPENWSVELLDVQGLHHRSSAALRSIAHVGGIWKAAKLFLLFPPFIRDGVYRWVARNRYGWFGKVDACMIPTPALRERFLP